MTREAYLALIREHAATNGGRPLGEKAFYKATGTSRAARFDAGFATYSEAVTAAGLSPNTLVAARDANEVLTAMAHLTRTLGRLPAQSDLKVARRASANIPSYEAIRRALGGWQAGLPARLREFCDSRAEFSDVLALIPDSAATPSAPKQVGSHARVRGYVYLARHGNDYKIGRSNDTARRRRELSLILPRELEHVHVIETDDPEGIERYWHERFASRRIRGEWFALRADDVAAFRRRRYQ